MSSVNLLAKVKQLREITGVGFKDCKKAIDETQDDGILIEYSSQPNEVVNLSDVPDCDDTLHTALVDYIKWKLYDDRADEASMIQGDKFRRRWRRSLRLDAGRDKIGGLRQIAPYPLA